MVFLFICLTIILTLIFSKIRIQIEKFKYSSVNKRHINKDYKAIIKIYILEKIPILKINITKTKLERLKIKEKIRKINFKLIEENPKLDKKVWEAMKEVHTNIKKLDLKIELGTENASLTSIIVGILSTIIAITIRDKMKNQEKQKFIVKPIYNNQNLINIEFTVIFEIKMTHIINIIYILNRKEKEEKFSKKRHIDIQNVTRGVENSC